MKTLLANMQHAVRTGQAVTIGGVFYTTHTEPLT